MTTARGGSLPLALALTLSLSGCGFDSPDEGSRPRVVDTVPLPSSQGVDRLAPLRVRFDVLLAPASVTREAVSLRSGPEAPFLEVWLDPVDNALVARPYRGRALVPNVRYRLEVQGVRDREGRTMEPFALEFETGEGATEPDLGQSTWDDVGPLFASHCVEGCHDSTTAAAGVRLDDRAAARSTLVGVATAQGSSDARSLRGLQGLSLVEEGDPGRSYLLYEMLDDPGTWGRPMPPEGPLREEAVATVADWILGGVR